MRETCFLQFLNYSIQLRGVNGAICKVVAAANDLFAGDFDECDCFGVAWLEPN
jgi:hypothetical protein